MPSLSETLPSPLQVVVELGGRVLVQPLLHPEDHPLVGQATHEHVHVAFRLRGLATDVGGPKRRVAARRGRHQEVLLGGCERFHATLVEVAVQPLVDVGLDLIEKYHLEGRRADDGGGVPQLGPPKLDEEGVPLHLCDHPVDKVVGGDAAALERLHERLSGVARREPADLLAAEHPLAVGPCLHEAGSQRRQAAQDEPYRDLGLLQRVDGGHQQRLVTSPRRPRCHWIDVAP